MPFRFKRVNWTKRLNLRHVFILVSRVNPKGPWKEKVDDTNCYLNSHAEEAGARRIKSYWSPSLGRHKRMFGGESTPCVHLWEHINRTGAPTSTEKTVNSAIHFEAQRSEALDSLPLLPQEVLSNLHSGSSFLRRWLSFAVCATSAWWYLVFTVSYTSQRHV